MCQSIIRILLSLNINLFPIGNRLFASADIAMKRGWRISGDMPTCGAVALCAPTHIKPPLCISATQFYRKEQKSREEKNAGEEIATYRMEIGVAVA